MRRNPICSSLLVGLILAALVLLSSCSKDSPVLNAVGSYSDVAIVTDLDLFNPVAFALKNALEVDANTGIKPEKLFNADIFDMRSLKKARLYKNVIIIGHLRGKDRASREIRRRLAGEQMKVMGSRQLFLATREDVYANNQNVLFLAGNDRNYMQLAIGEEAPALRGQIEKRNRERVREYLFAQGHNEEAERKLREQAGFRMSVPVGYEVNSIKQSSDGQMGCAEVLAVQPTRSVCIFWRNVDPTEVDLDDTDALLALRRTWGMFLDETLQDLYGFTWSREMFRGEEWPQVAGMYEVPRAELGGPFRTIFLLDVPGKRLYGINMLCFYPNEAKQPMLREVRSIAETFSPQP